MWKSFVLFIINHFLSSCHFFKLKRFLLNTISFVRIEEKTRILGPIYFGKLKKLVIGKDVWVGRNFSIEGNGTVVIGSNVDIGPQVTLLTGTHDIGSERRAGLGRQLSIFVGDYTWVCAKTTILGDISIGKSCILAACSLVNKNIENNTIVAGIPAKTIRNLEENL